MGQSKISAITFFVACLIGFWHSLAFADIADDIVSTTTLGNEELTRIMVQWDNAVVSDDLKSKYMAMQKVAGYKDIPGIGSGNVLRCDNPEIVNRVLDLYEKEHSRYPTHSYQSISEKDKETNPWLGADEGYMDLLDGMAESTFSPKIYRRELDGDGIHPWRLLYLAKVNPRRTLDCILNSIRGEKNGKKWIYNNLYMRDNGKLICELNEAFELISYMGTSKYSPGARGIMVDWQRR